jgi:hypothetical protein
VAEDDDEHGDVLDPPLRDRPLDDRADVRVLEVEPRLCGFLTE